MVITVTTVITADTLVEDVGFSQPTLACLRAAGIFNLHGVQVRPSSRRHAALSGESYAEVLDVMRAAGLTVR